MKRTVDMLLAICGLIILAPIFLLVAVFIRLDSPGPALFRQVRVGKGAQPFRIFKFRTMYVQAPGDEKLLTVAGDARITKAGTILRRFKIDELPQLINVVRGEMSLVGPRPEVPKYVAHYPKAARKTILSVRPGITDPASLVFIRENDILTEADEPEKVYLEQILPQKLELYEEYISRQSILYDMKIIFQTLIALLGWQPRRRNATGDAPATGMASQNWSGTPLLLRINPRSRNLLAFGHDLLAAGLAWSVAYWLRFNLDIPEPYWTQMWRTLVLVVALEAGVFWIFGLYQGVWRYASLHDLRRIVAAVLLSAILVAAALFMLRQAEPVPRSILLLHPLLLLLLMGGSRFFYRSWKERQLLSIAGLKGKPILILGAGDAGVFLARDLARSRDWHAIGFLDDDHTKHGLRIHGLYVFGAIRDLKNWSEHLAVRHAVIAIPSARHEARLHIARLCAEAGIKALTVPALDDLISGRVTVSAVREIELDDLLGRDPVKLDADGLHAWLNDRVVLITGAGGSIGSELCRQIARFGPRQLVLFELNELALYSIEQELVISHSDVPFVTVIGDVKDAARVAYVLDHYRPSAIFHAAAYKHVPLMEDENAWQAVLNNVNGTLVLARAALAQNVESFVFISTDKAVNPTSVMGATKRLAEMTCQALQEPSGTRFVMVRFGNVLGSSGSVIPKFREQIASGGPVTVTHPDVTRYFMSIPEAVQLVMQAGLMGQGGEIFVLDMGQPVRIVDLARELIRLSGFSENEIEIVYTGLRRGEKLYEEPLASDENLLPTPHPKLWIARARSEDGAWLAELESWLQSRDTPHNETVRRRLRDWVPEYSLEREIGQDQPRATEAVASGA